MPAAVRLEVGKGQVVVMVMIGVDPHKGSHTAVVIDQLEVVLGQVRVSADDDQARRLLEWAAAWPERAWAVEGARGTGSLLARQLVTAGERVLDVQPKLAARVRLLASGDSNKNDPNDARSVAIAALRSAASPQVVPDGHAEALKVWARRHRDLSRSRNQVVCRLHAVLCELIPGGVSKRLSVPLAIRVLEQAEITGVLQVAWHDLAEQLVDDLSRIDAQLRAVKAKVAAAVRASGTTLTQMFGVGPVIAATVIGDVRDVSRFATRDQFAAYNGTAPIEVSSGSRRVHRLLLRGNRRLNHAIHMAAITQVAHRNSSGRAYYEKKKAEGKTPKGSAARPQTPGQRRHLQAAQGRCRTRRNWRAGSGRAPGERHCRQRGRRAPRTPALRPSHSRTCPNPTTTATHPEKPQVARPKNTQPNRLTQRLHATDVAPPDG